MVELVGFCGSEFFRVAISTRSHACFILDLILISIYLR